MGWTGQAFGDLTTTQPTNEPPKGGFFVHATGSGQTFKRLSSDFQAVEFRLSSG